MVSGADPPERSRLTSRITNLTSGPHVASGREEPLRRAARTVKPTQMKNQYAPNAESVVMTHLCGVQGVWSGSMECLVACSWNGQLSCSFCRSLADGHTCVGPDVEGEDQQESVEEDCGTDPSIL